MPSARYGISEAKRSVDSEADAGETTMDEVSPSHPTAAMPSTPRFAVRVLASLLVPLCLAAGCGSAPKASGTSAAEAAYRRGDFAAAERLGREAEQSSHGLEREEAAYIAGLGAAKLGDLDKAARNLQIAAGSADTDLAALRQRVARRGRAARGEAGASQQAFRRATASPDPWIADRAERLAGSGSGARGAASPSGPASGFVVQAGAFSTEQAARGRASALGSTVRQAGFGEPRVVRILAKDGRSLWAVQIGAFVDRRQAGAARSTRAPRVGDRSDRNPLISGSSRARTP